MEQKRSLTLGIFEYFLIVTVLFFTIFIIFNIFFGTLLFQSCFLSFIVGFILFYVFIWSQGSLFERKEGKAEKNPEDVEMDTDKEKVDFDQIGKQEVDDSEGKRSSFLDKFKGKKTCENCGSKLVYKEEFESYYCPECHEYK